MSEKNNGCSCVQNVDCQVKDCRYHTVTDRCSAESIHVSNEGAQRKAETFCSTFENRRFE